MRIKNLDYGLSVQDNERETEIVIMGSCGQSGHSSLVVVFMGVDGGMQGVPEVVANIPYGMIGVEEIPTEIRKALRRISKNFIEPVTFLTEDDEDEIVRRWLNLGAV